MDQSFLKYIIREILTGLNVNEKTPHNWSEFTLKYSTLYLKIHLSTHILGNTLRDQKHIKYC